MQDNNGKAENGRPENARHRRFTPRAEWRVLLRWQNLLAAAASLALLVGTAGIVLQTLVNRIPIISKLSGDRVMTEEVRMLECVALDKLDAPVKPEHAATDAATTVLKDNAWDETLAKDMAGKRGEFVKRKPTAGKPSPAGANSFGYAAASDNKDTPSTLEKNVSELRLGADQGLAGSGELAEPGAVSTPVMTKSPLILKGLYANRGYGGARAAALSAYGGGQQAAQSAGAAHGTQSKSANESDDVTVTLGDADGGGKFAPSSKPDRTAMHPPSGEAVDTPVMGSAPTVLAELEKQSEDKLKTTQRQLQEAKPQAAQINQQPQSSLGLEQAGQANAAQAQSSTTPLLEKLRKIVIPEIDFRQANIHDIVDFLNKASREGDKHTGDPDQNRVNLVLNLQPGGAPPPQDPFEATAPTAGEAGGNYAITFSARYITLEQALKTITQVSGLKYSVEGNDVLIEPAYAGAAAKEATNKPEEKPTLAQAEPPTPAPQPFDVRDINAWTPAAQTPRSTFAMDVDTASYTLCRNYLRRGVMPPAGFVRPEEFVNAFDYAYPPPAREAFSIQAQGAPSPFRPGVHLLSLAVQGRRLGRENKPAALTLVVDTSGSMAMPDRLPLVKQALRMLIEGLQPADRVALVAFDAQPRLALEAAPAADKKRLLAAVDALQPSGMTDLEAALRLGYATAARGFVPGAANRVLLLSDGVANLGAGAAVEILTSVDRYRKQGLTLSVFGFGLGTFDDRMLATLAARGNGNYHYLDSDDEARRVLVDDLTATLHTMAADAKIQVEFNPRRVTQYRQIGYEPRRLRDEDFRNDAIVAGEVGSGQSATCLYELRLDGDPREPVATVRVRYRDLETDRIVEIEQPVGADAFAAAADRATPRFRLAACAAEFAELLRGSPHVEGSAFAGVARVLRPVALELSLDQRVRELLQLVTAAPGCARVEE